LWFQVMVWVDATVATPEATANAMPIVPAIEAGELIAILPFDAARFRACLLGFQGAQDITPLQDLSADALPLR
jgi:hypothetical protein